MTTLPIPSQSATHLVLPQAVELLVGQVEALQTAVHTTLRQNLFNNYGRLMTPRLLPETAQSIVQSYLHSLRTSDPTLLFTEVEQLVSLGLGKLSALDVTDTLYETSHSLLPSPLPEEIVQVLKDTRRHFLHHYMLIRERMTVTARETLYQNVEAALEKQVSQERQVRQELQLRSRELSREHALLTSLLDSIPDLIFYKDAAGAYLGCNTAFAKFVGRPEAEIVGLTDVDLFPHDMGTFFRDQDGEMLAQGQARHNEEWVSYPDGRRVLLDTLKTPFYGADKSLLGVIGISRDITTAYHSQEELLRLGYVVEQSLDGTAVADINGIVQFVNPTWATMHGYTPQELIGQHLSIFHTPEQLLLEVDPANQLALSTGHLQRVEIGHKRKDGSTFPTQMTIGLLKDSNGVTIGLVASIQDITAQKAAAAALQDNETRLAEATRIAKLYYWELDFVTQTFTFVPEYYELLGTSAAEEGGYTMAAADYARKYVPDFEVEIVGAEVAAAIATTDPNYRREFDSYNITKDGRIIPIRVRFRIIKDKAGNTIKSIGANQDITERIQIEQALRESETRFKSLVDNIPGTVYRCILDEHYTMELMSEDILTLSGYPATDFIGNRVRSYASIIYAADRELVDRAIRHGVETHTTYVIEYRIQRADGRLTWIGEWGQAIYDNNNHPLWLDGVLLDITPQKEIEASLNKRAHELQVVADVSTTISATTLEPATLLQKVCDLTKERFDLYHAHIYLLDETSQFLVLAGGAGQVGQQMVTQGWQIPLHREQSLVSRVARTRLGAIINDVRAAADFLPHPLLPETRAELAVPIIVGERVMGVLDVQATTIGHFSAEDVIILTTLATQVGVAVQNARSFAASEAARQELSQLTRHLTREGWQDYLARQEQKPQLRVVMGQAPTNGQAFNQSLVVQGEKIGQLAVSEPRAFASDAQDIMTAVAERLSSHIENLRLSAQTEAALAQTAQQANRLRILNEMGAALSNAETTNDIYQITARYTSQILTCDLISLALLEPVGDHFTFITLHGVDIDAAMGSRHPLAGTAVARALQEQRLLMAPQDFIRQNPADGYLWAAQGIPSYICAPLIVGERPLGTLNLGSQKTNAYGPTDASLVQQIVALLAATLESHHLLEETKRQAEREALVNAISQKIQNASTIQSAMQTAVTELGRALKAQRAIIKLDTHPDNHPNGQTVEQISGALLDLVGSR